jgi:coenzyme PQQ biosynthesis protein PqqD
VTTIDRASRPKLAPKARLKWDRHEERFLLLYPERGLSLSETASAILKLCDGERTVEDIAVALAAESQAPIERVLADALAFLEAMHGKCLIVTDGANDG